MDQKQKLARALIIINFTAAGIAGLATLRSNIVYGLLAGIIALILLPFAFLEYKDEYK